MKTAILILAAGSSSRMGKPKQLLSYKHTTLLNWTIEQAQNSLADEIYCVLGAYFDEIRQSITDESIKIIHNPNFSQGLSSSIGIGLKNIKNVDRVLIILADQPFITSTYLNKHIETSNKYPNHIIATNYDKTYGVPAIFPKKYFEYLVNLSGDKGAKELLNSTAEIIALTHNNLTDIDTVEDYNKLIQ